MKFKRFGAAMLVVLILSLTFASAASAATMGVVHTFVSKYSNVNLRTGPGTSYPSIAVVNNGDLVVIQREMRSWSRVTVKSGVSRGSTGYIFNKYITNLRDLTDISDWGTLAHIKTKYASSTVNLRKGPGDWYGVSEVLRPNDWLIILDKYNSRWYEVQVVNSERTGFIYRDYIANGVTGHTTASVNLRARASDSSSILDVVPSGTSVTVYYVGKNWSKIRYDGETGYVYNRYLKLF